MGFALSLWRMFIVQALMLHLYLIGFIPCTIGALSVFSFNENGKDDTCIYGIMLRSDWRKICIYQRGKASTRELKNEKTSITKPDVPRASKDSLRAVTDSHAVLAMTEEEKWDQKHSASLVVHRRSSVPSDSQTQSHARALYNHDSRDLASSPVSFLTPLLNPSELQRLELTSSFFQRKLLSTHWPSFHESPAPCIDDTSDHAKSLVPRYLAAKSPEASPKLPPKPAPKPAPSQALRPAPKSAPAAPIGSLPPKVRHSGPSPSLSPALFVPGKSSTLLVVAVAVPVTAFCTLLVTLMGLCMYRRYQISKSCKDIDKEKDNENPKDEKPLLCPWSWMDTSSPKKQNQVGLENVNSQVAVSQKAGGKVKTETNCFDTAEIQQVHEYVKSSSISSSESFSFSKPNSLKKLRAAEAPNEPLASVHTPPSVIPTVLPQQSISILSISHAPSMVPTFQTLSECVSVAPIGPMLPALVPSTSLPQPQLQPPPALQPPSPCPSVPDAEDHYTNITSGFPPLPLPLPPALRHSQLLNASPADPPPSDLHDPMLHPGSSDSPAASFTPVLHDPVFHSSSLPPPAPSSASVSDAPELRPSPPPPAPIFHGRFLRPDPPPPPTPPSVSDGHPRPPPPLLFRGKSPPTTIPLVPSTPPNHVELGNRMYEASIFSQKLGKDDKKDESSLPKLKPLFWDKVDADTNHSMVWDRLQSGSFRVEEDVMNNTLFGNGNAARVPPAKQVKYQPATAQKGPRILDSKRAQNITIQLRPLALTRDEIHNALLEGQGLSIEALEALLKLAPSQEEERKLESYSGDFDELDSAEHFLITVLEVPFAFQRCRDMLYRASFEEEFLQVEGPLKIMKAACTELKGSRSFRKLLDAVLITGNRMNMGTLRGDAQGSKLDTLLKLADVRSVDGKFTLLHFVIQEVLKNEGSHTTQRGSFDCLSSNPANPSVAPSGRVEIQMIMNDNDKVQRKNDFVGLGPQMVLGMNVELANVKKAADLDINAIKSGVLKLASGLQRMKDVLTIEHEDNRNRKISSFEDQYRSSMLPFVDKAEEDVTSIQGEMLEVLEMVKNLNIYFDCEAAKDESNLCLVFQIIRAFLAMLDKACNDVAKMKNNAPRKH